MTYDKDGSVERTEVFTLGEKGDAAKQLDSTGVEILIDAADFGTQNYLDHTYRFAKDGKKPGTIDCTTFMSAYLQHRLASQLKPDTKRKLDDGVLIKRLDVKDKSPTKLRADVIAGTGGTDGVVGILVELGLRKRVKPSEAQVGDIVQYWTWTSNESASPSGHTGMIQRIHEYKDQRTADLYGVHESVGGLGIRERRPLTKESDTQRLIVHIVRLN